MELTDAVVTVLTVAMVVGVPLAGLTLRFSLKPLVEAFIRLREAQLGLSGTSEVALLKERVAHLERVLDAHGLLDERRTLSVHASTPERLPAGLPLKDRERV
jgi:hypothetical protein